MEAERIGRYDATECAHAEVLHIDGESRRIQYVIGCDVLDRQTNFNQGDGDT